MSVGNIPGLLRRNPNLKFLWWGQVVSQLGDWFNSIALYSLLYELTGDPAVDTKQAETFKQAYGVTWPVVPIHGGVEDFAEILPRGLAGVDPSGFPLTLFLGADRSLVALHAGFPAADAAQSEQRRVAAEFRKHIEALLAKPAQPAK